MVDHRVFIDHGIEEKLLFEDTEIKATLYVRFHLDDQRYSYLENRLKVLRFCDKTDALIYDTLFGSRTINIIAHRKDLTLVLRDAYEYLSMITETDQPFRSK